MVSAGLADQSLDGMSWHRPDHAGQARVISIDLEVPMAELDVGPTRAKNLGHPAAAIPTTPLSITSIITFFFSGEHEEKRCVGGSMSCRKWPDFPVCGERF